MKALTVVPGEPRSAQLDEVEEPSAEDGSVLASALALGVCGTDAEILEGYGQPPDGKERLVLGHESLGRVLQAPETSELSAGDLVVGIVRRPDPVPCACCARGEWDMCRNGQYTERGIKGRDGYGAERWRVEPEYAVRVDPALGHLGVLLEPASVLAKAWEQIEHVSARACTVIQRVLVTGAGPVGLLGALLAAQRGFELHVLDRARSGPKPELARALGASYHQHSVPDAASAAGEFDVILEATGAGQVVVDAMSHTAPGGIVCLTGLSNVSRPLEVDATGLGRALVLQNDVVLGSVNANRRHYEQASDALARADREWLERLITRRVPLDRWPEALERHEDDVKVVVEFDARDEEQ